MLSFIVESAVRSLGLGIRGVHGAFDDEDLKLQGSTRRPRRWCQMLFGWGPPNQSGRRSFLGHYDASGDHP